MGRLLFLFPYTSNYLLDGYLFKVSFFSSVINTKQYINFFYLSIVKFLIELKYQLNSNILYFEKIIYS
jgi:hypothetical protein